MGLMSRLSMVFKSKASKALDRAEDPRETLDYSYEKQREMLTQVKRGIADVATSRKRVELQVQQLQQKATKLEDQARQALGQGREDLAREALSRRAAVGDQLDGLRIQYEQLQAEENKLTQASHRLQAKVEAFRTRKETIKASYTAAEAQTKIGEAVSGISEEMGDVGLAVERAENRTLEMRSRAGAIDELLASGVLDDATSTSDPLQAELDRVAGQSTVETELAALKAELGGGATQQLGTGEPRQLGAGGQEDDR
jgi:phage shock protein A